MLKTNKISRSVQKEVASGPAIIIVVVLGLYLAIGWFLATRIYQQPPPKTGLSFGQNFPLPDAYHNLDLRETKKVSFYSNALSVVKDLPKQDGVRHQVIKFNVPQDKLIEYGMISLPSTPAPKNGYPVIILCHAYYNPARYDTLKGYVGDMDFYSQHGYVVIKPDYRGQGMSRDQGRPEGAYYSMAYNIDVMDLIAAIKNTNYLNKNAINLWGHSMGAYIALRVAVLSADVKAVILLSGPVGDFDQMYKEYTAPSDANNPVASQIRIAQLIRHGTPLNNPDYWRHVSPLNYLNDSNARFQIHVGTADKVVPPKFSNELDETLINLGKQQQYYAYLNAKHSLAQQRPIIWSRSLEFLQSK